MSTTAMDKPSSELQQLPNPNPNPDPGHSNGPHIRKAFNLLKTHAAAVATFTLQWQDLEDHLQSIHNSIQSKLYHLQNPSPAKPSDTVNGIPIAGGKELARHLREHVKDHDALRDGLRGALAASDRAAELVLEAVVGFHPPEPGAELGVVRKSCVLLLEEFAKARPEIGAGAREEAVRVAKEWKKKMNLEIVNPQEVLGFLMLLSAFNLAGEFDRDDVLGLISNVVQRKQALDLFRSLGFSDKASDFVQNLISQKKCVEAVRFIHAFELVDKFPPVPLLRNHVNDAKKVAKSILKNSKSSPKEKDEAVNKEMTALRGVVRCIEEYKLQSDFSPEDLKERIEVLRNQKKVKKAKEKMTKSKALVPNSQAQQPSGNKRAFSDSKAQLRNPQNENKRPRTGPAVATVPNVYARAPTTVHLVHQHPVRVEGEGMGYLIPSAVMAMPSAASPNFPARAAPAHTMHHRSLGLVEGEGVEYLRAPASAATTAHTMHHRSLGLVEGEGVDYLRAPASAATTAHIMYHRSLGLVEGEGVEYFRAPASAATTTHTMHHRSLGLVEGEGVEHLRAPASAATTAYTMHHRSLGIPEGEGAEYLRTSASAAAAPNASNFYTIETHRYQPSASLTGQRAQYSPVYYARSALDTHTSLPSSSHGSAVSPSQRRSLASGAYGLTGSIPDTQRVSTAHYGLAGSSGAAEHINSLDEQYGTSAARALQHSGVPSNASPRRSLAYYPADSLRVAGHTERPLPSSSDYELLSKRNAFHL